MILLNIDEFIADYNECGRSFYNTVFRRDVYSNDLIMIYDNGYSLDCIRVTQLEVYNYINQGAITNIKII